MYTALTEDHFRDLRQEFRAANAGRSAQPHALRKLICRALRCR